MRMRPYTTVLPKPLMPVGDRPILDVIIRQLARHRFERVTIVTGHLAELIEVFFGDGSKYGSASTTTARTSRSVRPGRSPRSTTSASTSSS